MHIWMLDGRSLCDRRARPRPSDVTEMSDSQFEDYLDEQRNAPACGSCLLLAEHLRADAAVIYRTQGEQVHPPNPLDGWRALADTRWARKINLLEFLADPELDGQLRYERITDGIAPHRLEQWVEREEAAADSARTELAEHRQRSRSQPVPEA